MKTIFNSIIVFGAIVSFCIAITACNNHGHDHGDHDHDHGQANKKSLTADVPALKERKVELGSQAETDNIFNTYAKAIQALQKDPNDMEARLTISEVFITEARITGLHAYNYESAITVLEEIVSSDIPNNDQRFRALMNLATVQLSLHQFGEALQTGEKALALNNRNAGIYGVLVDANVELGNYAKAVEMSDKMGQIRPDLRSYSRVSYLREIHGDVEGAKEAMTMAVEAGYPGMEQTEWARITLGKLYEHYGDLQTAEAHYQNALAQRPNYPYALAALGNVERKKGNFAKAKELLTNATQQISDPGFYGLMGDLFMAQNLKKEAFADYSRALQMMENAEDPNHAHSHIDGQGSEHIHNTDDEYHGHEHGLEIANLYLKMGNQVEAALENAQVEYAKRPENIDINKSLAMIYYEMGELTKASDHLKKARATQSKDPELMTLEGLIVLKQGDTKAGKAMIKSAFAINAHQDAPIAMEAKKVVG